jgi:hypothetical protein
MDVPGFQFKESAVNYLVNSLAAQNANPGSYPVAFNIPYQRLKSRGVVSENKGLTIEEAAESLGRKVSTLRLAYKEGKLAVSWVPRFRPYGGPRPAAIDPLDLQIYVERRDSKKDLIKGQ